MRIKRMPIIFQNVLGKTVESEYNHFLPHAMAIRNDIASNGMYTTGPTSFEVIAVDEEREVTTFKLYQPINVGVDFNEDEERYFFQQELLFEDGLLIRNVEFDDVEEAYEILRVAAEQFDVQLEERFFHIHLEVYGEHFLDVYAPIKE